VAVELRRLLPLDREIKRRRSIAVDIQTAALDSEVCKATLRLPTQ
jgi:hypothetical protein